MVMHRGPWRPAEAEAQPLPKEALRLISRTRQQRHRPQSAPWFTESAPKLTNAALPSTTHSVAFLRTVPLQPPPRELRVDPIIGAYDPARKHAITRAKRCSDEERLSRANSLKRMSPTVIDLRNSFKPSTSRAAATPASRNVFDRAKQEQRRRQRCPHQEAEHAVVVPTFIIDEPPLSTPEPLWRSGDSSEEKAWQPWGVAGPWTNTRVRRKF